MLESTRLDYLAAMGVVGWVPRQTLSHVPGRIPAELLELEAASVVEESVALTDSTARAARPVDAARSAAAIRAKLIVRPDNKPEPVTQAEIVEAPAQPEVRLPPLEPFYLQLWMAGPCALLIETPEPGLESASPALRLLKDILRAVGVPQTPHLYSDFNWPLTRNPQFDRSAPAASLALQAFMRGRLENQAVVSVGCFGHQTRLLSGQEQAEQDMSNGREAALDGLPPAWFAPDLESLMRSSASKAQLWQQLRYIMSRWQVVNE